MKLAPSLKLGMALMRPLACIGLFVNSVALANPSPFGVSCTVTISNVSFGFYRPSNTTPNDSTGTATVYCQRGSKATYTLKMSVGSIPSTGARTLSAGAKTLNYDIYLDSARTQKWGDGTNGTVFVRDTMNIPNEKTGRTFVYPIYGRIPPGQKQNLGSYLDSITATLNYN